MTEPKTLPLDWQPGDVSGWRIALTPLDSLGFPMSKFGARVEVPDAENLEQFASSLAKLVRDTVIHEMRRVYRERDKEGILPLD